MNFHISVKRSEARRTPSPSGQADIFQRSSGNAQTVGSSGCQHLLPCVLKSVQSAGQGWFGCQVLTCHASHVEEAGESGSFEGLDRYEVARSSKPHFILLLKGSEIDDWLKR